MAYIIRAVHKQVTAAPSAQEFPAQRPCLQGLIIKLINLRRGNLVAHALLALPSVIQKFPKTVQVAL